MAEASAATIGARGDTKVHLGASFADTSSRQASLDQEEVAIDLSRRRRQQDDAIPSS